MASLQTVLLKGVVRALRIKNRLHNAVDAADDHEELRRIVSKWRRWDQRHPPRRLNKKWSHESVDIGGFDLHVLTRPGQRRAILYLHGGGYMVGPSRAEWLMMDRVASGARCDLALFDYPKAPEHDALITIAAVTQAYDHLAAIYGPTELLLTGTSAGGGLAVTLMSHLRDTAKPQPPRAVLLSPGVDMCVSRVETDRQHLDLLLTPEYVRFAGKLYAGHLPADDPRVSPTNGVLSGLAPVHVFAGSDEILFPDIRVFVERAAHAGTDAALIVGQGEQHAWPTAPTPEGRRAVRQIVEIIESEPVDRA